MPTPDLIPDLISTTFNCFFLVVLMVACITLLNMVILLCLDLSRVNYLLILCFERQLTNYNLSLLILSYYCFCEFEYSQAYFFLLCSPTSIRNYPPPQMEKLYIKTFLTLKHMFF